MQLDNGNSKIANVVGQGLVNALPKVIKLLTIVGTLAMLLVAGGIYTHNIHQIGDVLQFMPSLLRDFLVGLVVGIIALIGVKVFKKIQ